MLTVKPSKEAVILAHSLAARVLYLITEDGTGNVKVGVTRDARSLSRRLTNLSTGNPRILAVAAYWTFTGDMQAYTIEQAALMELALHRVGNSEWLFDVTGDYVRAAVEAIIQGNEL